MLEQIETDLLSPEAITAAVAAYKDEAKRQRKERQKPQPKASVTAAVLKKDAEIEQLKHMIRAGTMTASVLADYRRPGCGVVSWDSSGLFYVLSLRWVASLAINFVNHRQVAIRDSRRLVWPAYLAAGVVMTVAPIFNPISPSLILVSGIGASFGLNCGLLFMPLIIARNSTDRVVGEGRIPFSAFWLIVSIFICGLFIGIFGPGISFSN